LRRARISRGKKEADRESFPYRLLSSWHIAPIHLPLLGQNCWPHLSEGFSVSLWFNVEYIHESESAAERGKRVKKRNKPSVLEDSSFEGAGMMAGSDLYTKILQIAVCLSFKHIWQYFNVFFKCYSP
jgi:hypothetical protein